MKKSTIIIVLVLFFTNLFAQNFNNNWIDYQNKYLYFKVVEKGIYRINYTTLNSGLTKIGSSVTNPTFSPSQLKLVKNGQEVPIFIEDGGDGKIDPGDFVEFFGDGNGGWLDSALYDVPQSQNNKNFSLFSDTAYYYLTLNTSGSNQRISTYSDFNYSALNPAPFVYKEAYQQYTSNYETGATDFSGKTESEYTHGEGWFDGVFTYFGSKTKTISTPNPYTGAGAPQINFNTVITGASNASNISGKVVREITKAELGPINIGRNISEYAWDGRDEFGDPLGNGVYLYRVITKIAGSEIEKRSTDADRFFHKGFGKMYLMR